MTDYVARMKIFPRLRGADVAGLDLMDIQGRILGKQH